MAKLLQTEAAVPTGMEEALSMFISRNRNSPVCIICGTDKIRPEHFGSNESRREFKISQRCQGCQDEACNEE